MSPRPTSGPPIAGNGKRQQADRAHRDRAGDDERSQISVGHILESLSA